MNDALERPGILHRLIAAKPWNAVAYLVLNFVFGVVWFVTLVTLIATGVGTLITIFGAFILAAAYFVWRFAAQLERLRIKAFFGEIIAAPPPRDRSGTIAKQVRAALSDGLAWRELFYLFLLFPVGIAEFCIAAVLVTFPFACVATLFTYRHSAARMDLGVGTVDALPAAIAVAIAGVALIAPFAAILVAMANGHRALARALLGPNTVQELEDRVDSLTKTRTGAVDAALAERQRIERDLHDGAQQRLVKLAMDLGMARARLDEDPEGAQQLIANAHAETKLALQDLRDLVRGIHPAILTDRGLDAAISAIADRARVPTTVDIALTERLPDAVESTAYFVVLEALANIDKHARATAARLSLTRTGDALLIDVYDNGTGGATITPGGGLAGLRDRVAALDGRLSVSSPAGGPTHLHAEIPCGPSSPKTPFFSEKASPVS